MYFDIATYTNHGAALAARYWTAKHNFLYNLWWQAGASYPYVFLDSDLATFQDPDEFLHFVPTVHNIRARNRLELLQSMKPVGNGL
jgi:hypothetical protein